MNATLTKIYCARCKTTENIMPKPYNGHSYMCRDCNTERLKKYRATANGKEKTYKAIYKHQQKNPEKVKARLDVFYQLDRPNSCENCNKVCVVDGHHVDYSKPLEVIWLCRQCHATIHRGSK